MDHPREERLQVVSSDLPDAPRAYGPALQLTLLALTLLALLVAVGALALFTVTSWALLNTAIEYFGWVRVRTGSAALVLGTLCSWCVLYFLHDRIGLLGNQRAKTLLWNRAVRIAGDAPPDGRHFIEMRPLRTRERFLADTGWLLLYPERLVFVGDRECVTIPRAALAGGLRRLPTACGLLPAYIELPLRAGGRLRLLGRETAGKLSETRTDTEALTASLESWLDRSTTRRP